MVHTGYDPALVALSFAIAVLASYTALDLGARVRGAPAGPRWAWMAGAALAMGVGIWSMHFVGMLAFHVSMPVTYDVGLTVASFLLAVGFTGAAFAWVSRRGAQRGAVLLSGPVLGIGIAGMHYTGMAAMEMPGHVDYNWPVALASVLIAVTAATAALLLTFRQNNAWQKMAASVVMGLAVTGMHYTGMAAARFSTDDIAADPHLSKHAIELGQQNLALVVAGATFAVLFLALFAASVSQQRVQRRLHASEARFRAAAKAVGDIIWTNDATGRMSGPQPDWQAFTGQTEAECQGFGWADAVHPDDVEPSTTAWNAAVAARGEFIFEHRVRRHDGVYRRFAIRAVPVLTEDGAIREWVGVHADITDRRLSEAKLAAARDAAEAANRAKSTFIANMSHELRTPLSAIIGYAEMILEEAEEDGGDVTDDVRKIETNARHLLGLINDVLDLSKVESGKMDVYAEPFDAAAALREVAQASRSLADRNNNRLELALAHDLGTLEQDLTKVKQILLNLLGNAAKFTEHGTIVLGAERVSRDGKDAVRFRVEDTGIGISEDQLAKLFQRFQQADNSTTRRFGGTGLGLSLTKALAEMLGGSVAVESELGRGSIFSVTLPVRYNAERVRGQHLLEADLPTDAAEADADVVLVIDDDSHQRALMARFLQREGFATRTAADGEAGLELARTLKPRAILLDVVMPDMDGWAVLRALKSDPDLSPIPVVMVTFVDQRGLATSLGASDYVVKPVQWANFKSVMDTFKEQDNVRSGPDVAINPSAAASGRSA